MTEPPTSSPDLAAPRERGQLLATKLSIPRTRPDRLARARLLERLDEGMARALVLLCAPAGFGKTTLLADWATSTNWAVAWLSLAPTTATQRASGAMWSRRWTAPAKVSASSSFPC
jgi:LuxR family maltose regulon positive regulatory protein